MKSFKKLVSGSICTAVLCTAVSAQETKPGQTTVPQQSTTNQVASKSGQQAVVTSQQLASCWALDNQEEVILGKYAQDKSKNKDVSNFAKMITEEHQACLKKLSKFAPEASREGYLVENQSEHSKSKNESTSDSPAASNKIPSANGTTVGIDMIQLQREVAQQCVSDTKKYLNAKEEEDDFDKCFVGMQIAKHAAMHTKLVVLQRHTSDEMKQMVTEGIQATEKHMKAAELLMAKLEDVSGPGSTKSGK